MGVALAFHVGFHLDHIEIAPRSDIGLHTVHLAVLALLAIGAAYWLHKRRRMFVVTSNRESGAISRSAC
jgi:hypothetical protein